MRIKKCISPIQVTVMPHGAPSMSIGIGWQGDVDQVIGRTDRGPETLADHLGHHLTNDNFEDVNTKRAGDLPAKTRQALPAPQE